MASSASLRDIPQTLHHNEMDQLAADFLSLAQAQLAIMAPDQRESVVASIHAAADSLRARVGHSID